MNPDVFITIVFVGVAALAALAFLVFAVSSARREAKATHDAAIH